MFGADELRGALAALGALLQDRNLSFEIVVVGGSGLLLLGVIHRPTRDIDAIALVRGGSYEPAQPLPDDLRQAITDVSDVLGLSHDWLDPQVSAQLRFGLPEGFHGRTTKMIFGGLTVHVAGRFDQICLKLYAAADEGPESKHVDDLIALSPLITELADAARWVKTQDGAPEFPEFVDDVIKHLEGRLG